MKHIRKITSKRADAFSDSGMISRALGQTSCTPRRTKSLSSLTNGFWYAGALRWVRSRHSFFLWASCKMGDLNTMRRFVALRQCAV